MRTLGFVLATCLFNLVMIVTGIVLFAHAPAGDHVLHPFLILTFGSYLSANIGYLWRKR
jgi:ATP/ADP translocase